jgi:hypothetical protein
MLGSAACATFDDADGYHAATKISEATVGLILLIVLVLLLVCALPTWGYSRGWGYYPSGGLGLILLIVLILLLMGRI